MLHSGLVVYNTIKLTSTTAQSRMDDTVLLVLDKYWVVDLTQSVTPNPNLQGIEFTPALFALLSQTLYGLIDKCLTQQIYLKGW